MARKLLLIHPSKLDARGRLNTVTGRGAVDLAAGGDVIITAGQNVRESSELHERSQSGLSGMGNGGIGVSVGSSSSKGESHTVAVTQSDARSAVGATEGNVTITAGKNATIIGSDLIAGGKGDDKTTGNIDIQAQNIAITAGVDHVQQEASQSSKSSSLSIGIVGTPLDSVRNIIDNSKSDSKVTAVKQVGGELADAQLTAPQMAIGYGRNSSNGEFSSDSVTHSGSTLTGAGDITLRATGNGKTDAAGKALDGDILLSGDIVSAGGKATLDAQRNVNIEAATDTYTESTSSKSGGWSVSTAVASLGDVTRSINGGANNSGVSTLPFGVQKSDASGDLSVSQQNASVLNGDSVSITSRTGDVRVAGSGVAATNDIVIAAKQGSVDILSGQEAKSQSSDSSSSTIGNLGGNGYAGTTGFRSESHHADANGTTESTVRSQVASANGSVSITAKDDLTARGADIVAGRDVTLIGKNVVLDPAEDELAKNQIDKSSQYGVTLALSGYAVSAAQAVEQAARAAEDGKDGKTTALYGVKAGLAVANGIDGLRSVTSAGTSSTAIVKVTASVGGGSNSSEAHSQESTNQGTAIKAGNAVTIVATGSGEKDADGYATDGDIHGRGVQIEGKTVDLSAARDVTLESAQDLASMDSRSSGSNAGIGVGFALGGTQNGFTIELAASQNKANANGDSLTNQNSHIVGTDKVTVTSGRDTNLQGAQVTGNTVEAAVGRDFNVESRQDTDNYHSKESSAGFQASICVPPICYGTTVDATASLSSGKTNSTYSSVQEQSGVYAGQGGFDITVKGNTDMKGGVLASTADASKNNLTTGTLTTSDIENKAEYSSSNSTFVASYAGGQSVEASNPNLGPVQPAHTEWGGNANVLQGVANSLAASAAGNAQQPLTGNASGTTKSAIAAGTVTITDGAGQQAKTGKNVEETLAGLNRDTDGANQSIDKIFDAQKVKEQQEYDQLKSQLVQQAAPMIYKEVGDQLVGADPATKAAVHALVGGLVSQAMGGGFAAGAAGGAAASLAMEAFGASLLGLTDLSESDRKALVQIAGTIVGGVAGLAAGGSTYDLAAGASVGNVATKYNYLTHIQKKSYAEALSSCHDSKCQNEIRAEYAKIWTENRAKVENCSSTSDCLEIAQALRLEQQAQGQRIAELQAEGPSNWTEAERREYADLRLGDTSIGQMRSLAIANAQRLAGEGKTDNTEIANLVADYGIASASGIGGTVGKSSANNRLPIPEPTVADNGLTIASNPKHTVGMQGNRPNAGTEPINSLELFNASIPGSDGVRYAIDSKGNINRFYSDGNDVYHWSGSTGDSAAPLNVSKIPIDVKRSLGFKGK